VTDWKNILIIIAAVVIGRFLLRFIYHAFLKDSPDEARQAEQPGLTAVRLIGPPHSLKQMATAASSARWTESRLDQKGRLVLPVPAGYTAEDFAALLSAIEPHTADLKGLQMLGPNGGPVDDQGIEHPDD
jgi:hypothetical protein